MARESAFVERCLACEADLFARWVQRVRYRREKQQGPSVSDRIGLASEAALHDIGLAKRGNAPRHREKRILCAFYRFDRFSAVVH